MKKVVLIALVVMLLIPLNLFAGGSRDSGQASGKQRIGVALGPINNDWHAKLRQVIDDAVSRYPEYDWTVRNPADNNDQLNLLNVFRNERFEAMLIMPGDGNLVTPICEQIYNDGVKTVILNRAIATDKFTAFVEGDNFGGGVNAARFFGQRLNGQGNIVVLRSNIGTPIDVSRYTGFSGTLAREFPNIRILAEGEGRFTREAGLESMTNILPAHPRIDAVFAQDDETAIGALTAIRNANRSDIRFITGFGGMRNTYELFRQNDPIYIASMSYFPNMGYDGIATVVNILRGIPVAKHTVLGSVVVGPHNVNEYWDFSY